MFGSSKPVVLERYGSRRHRRRPPRWLVLALGAMAVGAGGVVLVQERYLPPRLSANDSARLREAFERADADRSRRKDELGQTSKQLEAALTQKDGLNAELAISRATAEHLRDDAVAVVGMMPPGSPGGSVTVRAGQFAAKGGMLLYTVVLTRDRASGKPVSSLMKLIVSGQSARGVETSAALTPVAVSIDRQEIVRGSLPLPDGFRPRETAIQLQDRATGRLLGKRVMLLQ